MTSQRVLRQRTQCAICQSESLSTVLELPKLPLTGIFVSAKSDGRYPPEDQALLLCGECGHGQLQNILDPTFVYGDTYTHRSSGSSIATAGNDFFFNFLMRLNGTRRFKRIVDIGCNDLYLLRKLEPYGERLLGVDPILKGASREAGGKFKVVGDFAERVDFGAEMGGSPDLVVSCHAFEHVLEPRPILEHVVEVAEPGALLVVEVPGFDSLLRLTRFDQVFHQHLHYYSVASFVRLIREIGAQYVAHAFNYSYWGGTMLVAFQKASAAGLAEPDAIRPTRQLVADRYALFCQQLASIMALLEAGDAGSIYGLGAAQMLPVLAYHMKSNLSFLQCILDDDPRRHDLRYPGLPVSIRQPSPEMDLTAARVLITALDSSRALCKRAMALGAREILMPVQTL